MLTWWFTVFAGYAAVVGIVTQGPSSTWGAWAAVSYGCAALAAWWSRGSALPLLIGACGAVAAPTIWLATRWQPGGEPAVVARAAFLLLHHGSPYLPSGHLCAQCYNPYLPAMSVFGLPRLAGLPGLLSNPASWMAVTSLALIATAIGAGLPYRSRYRARGTETLLRNTALAVVTPVLALPIALGTTDPPVIALMCLALACASRSAASTGTRPGGAASRWTTWSGLAALAIGTACAMVASSLVLRPPRDTRAATVRLTLGLTILFTLAPDARFGYFAYPGALLGWLALTGRSRTPGDADHSKESTG